MKGDDCNPDTLKVAELKEALHQRGLETNGNRADLVWRLKEALRGRKNDTTVTVSDSTASSGTHLICRKY